MRLVFLFASVLLLAAAIPVSVLLLREGNPVPAAESTPPAGDTQSPFAAGGLREIQFATTLSATGSVQLTDGVGTAPDAEGAGDLEFRLSDLFAFGELDGDGRQDAAFVVLVSRMGRPHGILLGAATNADAIRTFSEPLPARSLVRELRIDEGMLSVRFRDRDAASERQRTYRIEQDALVVTSDDEAPDEPSDAGFAYSLERLTVPASGETARESRLAPGVGADFVISLGEGQGFSLWAQSEFSNAIISVFGTRDQRTLVSRRDYVSLYTGVAPIAQDYVVRVINVGGSELPFRLTVTAPGGTQPGGSPTSSGVAALEPPPGGFLRPSEEFSLAGISSAAASALEGRDGRSGAAAIRLSDGRLFTAGSGEQLELVSVAKVVIMLAVMARAEEEGRALEPRELDLLWPMITFSDNDSATLLWQSLGSEAGVSEWLAANAIAGISPAPRDEWGATSATPAALATLLGRLFSGDLVSPEHRDLALEMLSSVIDGQRWGVSAGAFEAGDAVALKNGWFPEDDGWQVVSAGLIVPETDPANAYVLVVMTDRQDTMEDGVAIIEEVARPLNAVLR